MARLQIRESPLHGRGTFALAAIPAGDVVTIWPHRILRAHEDAPPGNVWPRLDGTRVWVPADNPTAPEAFLNHSCDPNLWLGDEVTLVARRAIACAQELTIDYALFELDPAWVSRWHCRCCAVSCRGSITGRDFQQPDLQARYGQHFHPEVVRRIAGLKPG
jgi:hypothetical protein